MDYEELELLRRAHPAWRLLRADHASLVIFVLGAVFVEGNARQVPAQVLVDRLDDALFELRDRLGDDAFPRPAAAYLDEWAKPESGWLRKYYPPGSDEPHYDATPAVEKAIGWITGLQSRSFVGTESRLNTLLDLLRQMAYGAQDDAEARLTELRRRRAEIDAEISAVQAGDFSVLDPVAQRDRFQQFSSMARELLADFREVEANFRALDRQARERVATWAGSKGELLDEVVGGRASITDSDQGRSFAAFYDFLLSHHRQAEFGELLDSVLTLPALHGADRRLRHIHYDWMDAAEQTQATVRRLSEQLRRFLDDQVWLENRRVMEILKSIESRALALREHDTSRLRMTVADTSPTVGLPMERGLYVPVAPSAVDSSGVTAGGADVDVSTLFEQVHVDPERLASAIRAGLLRSPQLGLAEVVAARPLEHGLAELLTYFSLHDPAFRVDFDERRTETVRWTDDAGTVRQARVPRVTFVRAGREIGV